jgi:hypothetical protein
MKAATRFLSVLFTVIAIGACGKEPAPPTKPATPQAASSASKDHKLIDLGVGTADSFTVKATRDEGPIKPGGDAPIEATVTGGAKKPAKVRFWVGLEDAKASIKASAEIENATKAPNTWHTHAQVPDPIPAGSRIWVEIEDDAGAKSRVSFDLKM